MTEFRQILRQLAPPALRRILAALLARRRLARDIDEASRRGVVPPRRLWTLVGGDVDFVEEGRSFFRFLVERGGVHESAAVLDIGCGLGKHAIHFAEFLGPGGRYEGFDVEPARIDWCRKAIAPRYPNTRFVYVPIHNEMYSPDAAASAEEFVFPYLDQAFDLVFLASVFTHMFDRDVAAYAQQIARVLKPGGVCVATLYLLNPSRLRAIAAGGAAFTFALPHKGSWIEREDPPEAAVAQDEAHLLETFAAAGLEATEPVRYGAWDRSSAQDQDFVVFRRSIDKPAEGYLLPG